MVSHRLTITFYLVCFFTGSEHYGEQGIYLSLGLMSLFFISFFSNLARSTGFIYSSVVAGYFNNFSFGRVGRFSNPPLQLGQTFCKTFVTQSIQNVHSNVQIIASVLSFGNFLPQFSHTGLNSNIALN